MTWSKFFTTPLSLAWLVSWALAYPTISSGLHDQVRTVFEFPNGTFVENLAVRSNGQILVSIINNPQLVLIDPTTQRGPVVVHDFAGTLGITGIAEYAPDVFACITGNFSIATGETGPGSWALWSIDLRGVDLRPNNTFTSAPTVYKLASVPNAQLLNGISVLSRTDQTILVGDIRGGVIYRVNIGTGDSHIAINNTFTAAGPAPPFPLAGVDGIHVREDALYFTNVATSTFYKTRINRDGTQAGAVTAIAHTLSSADQYDDFTFDQEGNAFLVTGRGNSIEKISPDGKRQMIVAGDLNSTAIAEPTSAAFGRGVFDKNILYVTTAGGLATPVDGDIIIGGQLVAVNVN